MGDNSTLSSLLLTCQVTPPKYLSMHVSYTCPGDVEQRLRSQLDFSFLEYLAGYCSKPPADECPYGYCPQPDVAGFFIRMAAYLSSICTVLIMLYSRDSEKGGTLVRYSYWASFVNAGALLTTTIISVVKHQIARYHTLVATLLVGSPVMAMAFWYTLRSFCGRKHRGSIDRVFGPGQKAPRVVSFFWLFSWIAFAIFQIVFYSRADNPHMFFQPSCQDHGLKTIHNLWQFIWSRSPIPAVGISVFGFLVLCWVAATAWNWSAIRIRSENDEIRWFGGRIWDFVCKVYPPLRFYTLVVAPFAYWITVIETLIWRKRDNEVQITFGQLIALIVTIPPVFAVIQICFFNPPPKVAPRPRHLKSDSSMGRSVSGINGVTEEGIALMGYHDRTRTNSSTGSTLYSPGWTQR